MVLHTLESLGGDGYDLGQSKSTIIMPTLLIEDTGQTYGSNTWVVIWIYGWF